MASSTVVGFVGLDELSLEIASLLVKSGFRLQGFEVLTLFVCLKDLLPPPITCDRVLSDEWVLGVGWSEVSKSYGDSKGLLHLDVKVQMKKFNLSSQVKYMTNMMPHSLSYFFKISDYVSLEQLLAKRSIVVIMKLVLE
ncbi:hypothetical protein GW17_00049925, partial [Ensete ventricosum]